MSISKASIADSESIKALLQLLQLPTEDITDSMLKIFWVCKKEQKLLGVIGVEIYAETILLRSLAVSPESQNHGIGLALYQEALSFAQRQQVRDIFLLTDTARKFFERMGFKVIERSEAPEHIQQHAEFTHLCSSKAKCMLLRI